jgi:hypothetical protein
MLRKTDPRVSDIVVAIADELSPLQEKKSPNEVEQSIRATLEKSRWLMDRYSRAAIRANRPHIKKLQNSIRRLKDDIHKAPRPVQISMFSGMSQPYGQEAFLNDLEEMGCRLADASDIGRRDMIKQASAEIALNFFVFYSTKIPSSGSAKSPMRIVAGMVYEYFTGEAGQDLDLERPCERAIKKVRDHPVIRTNSRKRTARVS